MGTVKQRIVIVIWAILIVTGPLICWSAPQTVRIPITLDYSFLRSTFVQQAFTKPGEKAVPLNVGDGCTLIELWDPKVGPENALLKLSSNIKVQAGVPLLGRCLKMSEWQGQIEVLQRIMVDEAKGLVGFQPTGFKTLGPDQRQTGVDKSILDLLQTYLNPYLSKLTFDANGAVKGLSGLLPLFFSNQDLGLISSSLATLRPGAVQIKPEGLGLDLLMDVEGLPPPSKVQEGPPTETEVGGFTKNWQDWDAFLIYQMQALGNTGKTATDDDKGALMEALLDSRYAFVQRLSDGTLSKDFVTQQFTGTWQNIGGTVRKYLSVPLSKSPTNYLAFFGVSDALVGLTQAGLGISPTVSGDGLQQLTKALLGTGAEPSLTYSYAVDNDLRSFFGLKHLPDTKVPGFDGLEIDFPDEARRGITGRRFLSFLHFVLPHAHAGESSKIAEELEPWVMKKDDLGPYLDRVRGALEEISNNVMTGSKLDGKYQPLYRHLVYATAWQESCWRQFITSGGKLRPILSYNQTSVGLMQINERVWRGIYQTEALRWDTRYNIRAGCEILDLYLRRYALRRAEGRDLDEDGLARAAYAMYNGGPGQLKKFVARRGANKYLKIDQLFWEKYSLSKARALDKVSVCLTGK
jgi:hypothetical protein